MSEARETRIFMISPNSIITPDQLVRTIHAMGKEVNVKETCYGCLVEGKPNEVRQILKTIRDESPTEIFSKVRGYPCGDPRRCRAQHGTRPGFAQLEAEWDSLPKIQYGLENISEGQKYDSIKEKKQCSLENFKKICEANK